MSLTDDLPLIEKYIEDVHRDAEIERACFEYLSKQGYSNWSVWEITNDSRRRLAATWFAFHVQSVMDDMRARDLMRLLVSNISWKIRATAWMRRTVGRIRDRLRGAAQAHRAKRGHGAPASALSADQAPIPGG